jgi:hypothetical protein
MTFKIFVHVLAIRRQLHTSKSIETINSQLMHLDPNAGPQGMAARESGPFPQSITIERKTTLPEALDNLAGYRAAVKSILDPVHGIDAETQKSFGRPTVELANLLLDPRSSPFLPVFRCFHLLIHSDSPS